MHFRRVFYSQGKPLNGSWLSSKLKYDGAQSALLGTWFAGPLGAADKFLSFFFDGTYRFSIEPSKPEANEKSFAGKYKTSGSQLAIDVPRKGRVSARIHRERKVDPVGASNPEPGAGGGSSQGASQRFRDHL